MLAGLPLPLNRQRPSGWWGYISHCVIRSIVTRGLRLLDCGHFNERHSFRKPSLADKQSHVAKVCCCCCCSRFRFGHRLSHPETIGKTSRQTTTKQHEPTKTSDDKLRKTQ